MSNILMAYCFEILQLPLRLHITRKVASKSITAAIKNSGLRLRAKPINEEFGGYRWGVIRHPFDRVVSAYRFFCHEKADYLVKIDSILKDIGCYPAMPFDEFWEIVLLYAYAEEHLTPQAAGLGKREFDTLCRYEDIGESWEALRCRFPSITEGLPHLNQTSHESWKEYFTAEQESQGRALYFKDFEIYENASSEPSVLAKKAAAF